MESEQSDEKEPGTLDISDKKRKNPVEHGLPLGERQAVFHGMRVEIDDNL